MIDDLIEGTHYHTIAGRDYLTHRGAILMFLRENGIPVDKEDKAFLAYASNVIAGQAVRQRLTSETVIEKLANHYRKTHN
jgi:hypothetical protein